MVAFILVMFRRFLITATLLFLSFSGAQHYDELYDADGNIRPHYVEALSAYNRLSRKEREVFLRKSRRDFQGDNVLSPLPRIIEQDQYDNVLKPGIAQRGRAFLAFLNDHYFGKRRYLRAGIIEGNVIQEILHRNHESGFTSVPRFDDISLFYGPDIIRDRNGVWRVIEDNFGYIGGPGDLILARKLISEKYPKLIDKVTTRHPDQFYKNLISRYRTRSKHLGEKIILYMIPPYPDYEDARLKKIFSNLGGVVITPWSRYQMKVKKNGVYIFDFFKKRPRYEKAGFVFLDGEYWLDPLFSVYQRRHYIEEAQFQLSQKDLKMEIRRSLVTLLQNEAQMDENRWIEAIGKVLGSSNIFNYVPLERRLTRQAIGLTQAILEGKVMTQNSPGTEFIGDKIFYKYIEDLIWFYLKEQPILRNIKTYTISESNKNSDGTISIDEIFNNPKKYVLKMAEGRGGSGVWVMARMKKTEIKTLERRIRTKELLISSMIAQESTPLSQIAGDMWIFASLLTFPGKDLS